MVGALTTDGGSSTANKTNVPASASFTTRSFSPLHHCSDIYSLSNLLYLTALSTTRVFSQNLNISTRILPALKAAISPPLTMSQDPPSPPSIPPPLPSAPGPRATRLQTLLDSAISHTISSITYRNFASCFPTIQTYNPAALEDLHRNFTTLLDERAKAELAAVMDSRDVVRGLNGLDELLVRARARKDAASPAQQEEAQAQVQEQDPVQPSSLPPDVLLAAHLRPFLRAQTDALDARLHASQSKNVSLAEEIRQQRGEIEALVAGLEGVVQDLERAGGVLDEGVKRVGARGELEAAATAPGAKDR